MDGFPEQNPRRALPEPAPKATDVLQPDTQGAPRRMPRRGLLATGGAVLGVAAISLPFWLGGGKEQSGDPIANPSPRATASPSEKYCGDSYDRIQEFNRNANGSFVVRVLAACVTNTETVLRSAPDANAKPAPNSNEPLAENTEVEVQCRAEGGVMINDAGIENSIWLSVAPEGNTHTAGFLNLAQLGRASGLPENILGQIPACQVPGAEIAPTTPDPNNPPIVRD